MVRDLGSGIRECGICQKEKKKKKVLRSVDLSGKHIAYWLLVCIGCCKFAPNFLQGCD